MALGYKKKQKKAAASEKAKIEQKHQKLMDEFYSDPNKACGNLKGAKKTACIAFAKERKKRSQSK